nr:phosphoglycolate phosphatase [uncultured bacterium]
MDSRVSTEPAGGTRDGRHTTAPAAPGTATATAAVTGTRTGTGAGTGTATLTPVRRGVIFDLDGVLVDSFAVMHEAFDVAYREVVGAGPAPFEEYRRHQGRYFPDIMRIMGLPLAMEEPFVRESYRLAHRVPVFDGVVELLLTLRARGFGLAVATGKSGERARSLLGTLGLLPFFAHVIGSDEVARPKPAPDIMGRFDATPEMFFYRLTQVVPERFGLSEIFFLRFHHATGSDDYRLTKVLNLSHVPVPHGIGLDEHYCRRWPSLRLLAHLDRPRRGPHPAAAEATPLVTAVPPVVPPILPIAAQRSRFLNEDATFFVIAVSRPLSLTEGVRSCVSIGFLVDEAFRERVRFWSDPEVPEVAVNLTCERCGLTPDECQDRVAPPTIFRQEREHEAQARALAELLERGDGSDGGSPRTGAEVR